MKNKKMFYLLISVSLLGLLLTSCDNSDPEKQQKALLKAEAKEQKKIKSGVGVSLRAAHVAYNVKRYDLAIENYNKAINAGWTDGIDLYQYADSLENTGKTEESALYYQRAYDQLQKFYPNHSFIQVLEAKGY
jgi:tetratricopeptide (TPR) repeat protein